MTRVPSILLAAFAAAMPAAAQTSGQLGAGVIIGEPIGPTIKYWLDDTRAIDAGVGFGGSNAVFFTDVLFHAWDVAPQPSRGRLGAYVGLGPRIEARDDDALFGLRTIAGGDYRVQGRPIELFFEAGPVFQLTPSHRVDVDGGLGVRFYFGLGK
ncbi:MAG: hypothetical protein HY078_04005 [Elusimicrobia bacterium]|nr:hypothetical protein [Elusimicrobiota bacterium]